MKPMPEMNEFALACHVASEAKGWTNLKRTDAQTTNLMVSENSEALEDFRNKKGVNEVYYEVKLVTVGFHGTKKVGLEELEVLKKADGIAGAPKPCGIPIELADTIIRVGQQCGTHKIDLLDAMEKTQHEVFQRTDFNEAIADATMHLSDAWVHSKEYDPEEESGDPIEQAHAYARAVWSILYFCENAGIDIWAAVEEKMAFNETRPQLHGGKAI